MAQAYSDLIKQVVDLRYRVRDCLDTPSDPAAQDLKAQIQALEDALQSGERRANIDQRLKRIIQLLGGEAESQRIMDYEHLAMFSRYFENLRSQTAKLL